MNSFGPHDKHNNYNHLLVNSIDSILSLLFYRRCMFGVNEVVLDQAARELVEHAFGLIKTKVAQSPSWMSRWYQKLFENYFFFH